MIVGTKPEMDKCITAVDYEDAQEMNIKNEKFILISCVRQSLSIELRIARFIHQSPSYVFIPILMRNYVL